MEPPPISFIIPVYMAESYLRRGLDSLLAQTDSRWEAICINDGSPDNCAAILEEYAHKDCRFRIRHQENKGVSAARNLGIRLAEGAFVTFMDSDDWLSPNIVSTLQSHIQDDLDIILYGAQVEYGDGVPARQGEGEGFKIRKRGRYAMTPDLLRESVGTCWGKVYRRQFLLENELLFPLNMRQEDEVFYRCSMAVAREVYFLPDIGYHYLQAAGSYMHSGLPTGEMSMRYLIGMEIVCRYYGEHNCFPLWEDSVLDFVSAQLWNYECNCKADEFERMRQQVIRYLQETEIPVHFREDHRFRYIIRHPRPTSPFYRMSSHAGLYGLCGHTLFTIQTVGAKKRLCIPPVAKLIKKLRALFS